MTQMRVSPEIDLAPRGEGQWDTWNWKQRDG